MKSFNYHPGNPRVLIAPLDWGLGHATRCIPIIKELIHLNCNVFIVADKKIFALLKKEFPDVVFLRYKGYEIAYSRHKIFFHLKLLFQLPKIILSVREEKKWLQKTIKEYSIDAVISDNRLGMYDKNVPSVYITHQLYMKTGNRFLESVAQKIHYYFIRKYSACWVPDSKVNGLAGELSHPKVIPKNVSYIGPLSRFNRLPFPEKIYDLLVTISGPEPQRSIFERELTEQLKHFPGRVFMVRGLPSADEQPAGTGKLTVVNHLPAEAFNRVMEQSEIIISRSGYTTVMDLAALGKKAVLIPTPGQTEQEYLAKFLLEKHYFLSAEQKDFSIEEALKKAVTFRFEPLDFSGAAYKKTIHEFVLSLKTMKFAS